MLGDVIADVENSRRFIGYNTTYEGHSEQFERTLGGGCDFIRRPLLRVSKT